LAALHQGGVDVFVGEAVNEGVAEIVGGYAGKELGGFPLAGCGNGYVKRATTKGWCQGKQSGVGVVCGMDGYEINKALAAAVAVGCW